MHNVTKGRRLGNPILAHFLPLWVTYQNVSYTLDYFHLIYSIPALLSTAKPILLHGNRRAPSIVIKNFHI